jgi:hypothetical protein
MADSVIKEMLKHPDSVDRWRLDHVPTYLYVAESAKIAVLVALLSPAHDHVEARHVQTQAVGAHLTGRSHTRTPPSRQRPYATPPPQSRTQHAPEGREVAGRAGAGAVADVGDGVGLGRQGHPDGHGGAARRHRARAVRVEALWGHGGKK